MFKNRNIRPGVGIFRGIKAIFPDKGYIPGKTEWVFGGFLGPTDPPLKYARLVTRCNSELSGLVPTLVYADTVSQSLGLFTKDDKDPAHVARVIFEGDWVLVTKESDDCDGKLYRSLELVESITNIPRITGSSVVKREVLGNIWDDPDLDQKVEV